MAKKTQSNNTFNSSTAYTSTVISQDLMSSYYLNTSSSCLANNVTMVQPDSNVLMSGLTKEHMINSCLYSIMKSNLL